MIASIFMLFIIQLQLHAQWQTNTVISPEVQKDNSVVFRLYAPEAKSVKLTGTWMSGMGNTVEMKKPGPAGGAQTIFSTT